MPLKFKIKTQDQNLMFSFNRVMVILFTNLIFSYQFSRPFFVEGSLVGTHLLVTHVGPCEAVAGIVLVKEFTLTTRDYDSVLSGDLNVTEDVDHGWTVKATMQKCQDIRNIDTCDHFRTFWVERAGCKHDVDQLYTNFYHHTTPELSCPIRAGTYKIQDYPIFTADSSLTVHESKISTSVFGYTLRLEGTTVDKRELFCVEAYLQLLYLRQHNWVGNRRKNQNQTTPQTTTPKDEGDDDDE